MRVSSIQQQDKLVATLWLTYALFYLGRVNFSVVLPGLAEALNISRAEAGALGTAFFWVYGIGHFVSGEIGNHVSPFRMVCGGLLIIALANILFSFQTSLLIMLVLWGINAVGQSAGWAPMFRILAERLDRAHIKRVSTIMPISYVAGTAVTWAFVGAIAAGRDWQVAFWLPGLLTLLVLAFWWKAGFDAPVSHSAGLDLARIGVELRQIWFLMVAAALVGFVFNGMTIWLPTYILDTGLIAEHAVGSLSAAMQVVAIAGLVAARYRVMRSSRVFITAVQMFAAAGIAFVLMAATSGRLALLIITLGLIMLNGAFGLTVSSMPLLLAGAGRASSVTGSVNMMSNLFGGVAGIAIGALVEKSGWPAAFALWGGALLVASVLIWAKRGIEDNAA